MSALIKIDLDKMITTNSPINLELGCGRKKKEGRICIDKLDLPNVDIVADLDEGLSFLPDNSVDAIHSKSFFEHIDNLENLMGEIVRVLKPNGQCYTFVPHFSNPYYYSDYTHNNFFGLYTFYYFVDGKNQLKRKVPTFYTDIRIKVISHKLVFQSSFKVIKPFKKMIGAFINLHSFFQEFYEENLCYIFPCYGIKTVFIPDK